MARAIVRDPQDPEKLIGKSFGLLTPDLFIGKKGYRNVYRCRCKCGGVSHSTGNNLKRGISKSCGCKRREGLLKRNITHGMAKTGEYAIWSGIKTRATNPNIRQHKDYSDRGIGMCERWKNSFEAFFSDMGQRPSPKHSIERVNNHCGYDCGQCQDCKDRDAAPNCRWATSLEQNNNKRSNRLIMVNGITKTLAQWLRESGVKPTTFFHRVNAGWNEADAATHPPSFSNKKGGRT